MKNIEVCQFNLKNKAEFCSVYCKIQHRHIIMTTHDPLVIAGLEKEQIQILKRDEKTDVVYSGIPDTHPRGLSYGGILTSDMFGFRSDLDSKSLALLDQKVLLTGKDGPLLPEEEKELKKIDTKLDEMGFLEFFSDPHYMAYIKAINRKNVSQKYMKKFLTKEEKKEQSKAIDEILQEIEDEANSSV